MSCFFLIWFLSVQQSSFYGYAGMLPRRFTQAVMTGESKNISFLFFMSIESLFSLSRILSWGSAMAVGSVCCVTYVTHVKEPNALIAKIRDSPQCSWYDRQHIAPQHLVKHYMSLSKGSRSHTSNVVPHILQENTE